MDKSICTDLPDLKQEPKLFGLVKTFQIHCYIKICQKYKNGNCRFHYGSFFTDKTIIAERLPDEIPTIAKLTILEKWNFILKKMRTYIDEELNPAQCNNYNPLKKYSQKPKTIDQMLDHLNIINSEYERALSILEEDSFTIHT